MSDSTFDCFICEICFHPHFQSEGTVLEFENDEYYQPMSLCQPCFLSSIRLLSPTLPSFPIEQPPFQTRYIMNKPFLKDLLARQRTQVRRMRTKRDTSLLGLEHIDETTSSSSYSSSSSSSSSRKRVTSPVLNVIHTEKKVRYCCPMVLNRPRLCNLLSHLHRMDKAVIAVEEQSVLLQDEMTEKGLNGNMERTMIACQQLYDSMAYIRTQLIVERDEVECREVEEEVKKYLQ